MKKQERFAFKKELLQVHKKDRRNKALLPEIDEFEFKTVFALFLPRMPVV